MPEKEIFTERARRELMATGDTARLRSARAGSRVPGPPAGRCAAIYQRPRCTTSPNGRRLGLLIGASGRSAG